MRLRDILDRKGSLVVCVEPDREILDAIAILNERRIGALLVRLRDQVEGIVTERDVLRVCHERAGRIAGVAVADVMTRDLVIGTLEDTVGYAKAVMTERRIRHLPVQDGSEASRAWPLAGLVSIGDLVAAELEEADVDVRMLHAYVNGSFPWAKAG